MCFSKCPDCKETKEHKLTKEYSDEWFELYGDELPLILCETCRLRLRAQLQDEKDRERGIL